jgi:GTP pyrophosphokinase
LAFLAGLKILGTDRVGMINDITRVISAELKVNMRSITVDSENGIFEGYIKLFVNDTRHLDLLMEKLHEIPDVVDVYRVNTE